MSAGYGASAPGPATKTIAVLAGDGIGPEVMAETVKVLQKVGELFGHTFTFKDYKASMEGLRKNALLGLRKRFKLAMNLRPSKVYPFSHFCRTCVL